MNRFSSTFIFFCTNPTPGSVGHSAFLQGAAHLKVSKGWTETPKGVHARRLQHLCTKEVAVVPHGVHAKAHSSHELGASQWFSSCRWSLCSCRKSPICYTDTLSLQDLPLISPFFFQVFLVLLDVLWAADTKSVYFLLFSGTNWAACHSKYALSFFCRS